jgi:hypothetical protein
VNVGLTPFPSWSELFPELLFGKSIREYERDIAVGRKSRPPDPGEEPEIPLFSVNAKIENLSLHNIATSVVDKGRPVIRIGGDSEVQAMTLDLSINDPTAMSVPIKLLGRVQWLNLSLDWPGGDPIQQAGGSIGHLEWGRKNVGTSPLRGRGD